MSRKAQGISINTIVITAIALLVLVVVATILISQSGAFSKAIQNCQEIGGKCKEFRPGLSQNGCEASLDGFQRADLSKACTLSGTDEVDATRVCCVPGSN